MGKITKIEIKVPKESTLTDGTYLGVWGGYCIEVQYNGKTYQLTTDEGVKGTGFKVMVTIKDGVGTFDVVKN